MSTSLSYTSTQTTTLLPDGLINYSLVESIPFLCRVYTSATCCAHKQHVAGNKQLVARNMLLVARNLLPRNKLRWRKRGFT